MSRRHQRALPAVAGTLAGLGLVTLLAIAAWQTAKNTVLQDRALTKCGMSPPPELDPHHSVRSEAKGVRVKWHTFGYECEYTREDGTVFHLPPPSH